MPLVPLFTSQNALRNASANDMTWVTLTWQNPNFYHSGQCESLTLTSEQREALSEALIQHLNWGASAPPQSIDVTTALSAILEAARAPKTSGNRNARVPPQHKKPKTDTSQLMVVRAKNPVNAVTLRYKLPTTNEQNTKPSSEQSTYHSVHCQVVPMTNLLTETTDARPAQITNSTTRSTTHSKTPTSSPTTTPKPALTSTDSLDLDPYPFIGIPLVTYALCGPYSDADPIEAKLISASVAQSHQR
jgi:hypothetical protein